MDDLRNSSPQAIALRRAAKEGWWAMRPTDESSECDTDGLQGGCSQCQAHDEVDRINRKRYIRTLQLETVRAYHHEIDTSDHAYPVVAQERSEVVMRLYRAAKDDYVYTGYSFATEREVAEAYLDNPGFGGPTLFRADVHPSDGQLLDLTDPDLTVRRVARFLGFEDPGAIGIDEWIPRDPDVLDAIRAKGYLWAIVAESFPSDTTTWIWCGTSDDDEPVLRKIRR